MNNPELPNCARASSCCSGGAAARAALPGARARIEGAFGRAPERSARRLRLTPRAAPVLLALFAAACCTAAAADTPTWTATLKPGDFTIGPSLATLNNRHRWRWRFEQGFEVAVRKSAIPIPAPQCRMDYLILTIPSYYPEGDKPRATPEQRRATYDSLLSIQASRRGEYTLRFNALSYWRTTPRGPELTGCNIYFALPLE